MAWNIFRACRSFFFRKRGKRLPSRRIRQLWLERLEDRLAPTTVSWNVDGNGDWNTRENWLDDQGVQRLPGPGDNVVINRAVALSVTIRSGTQSVNSIQTSSGESLVISAGSLTVIAPSQIDGPFIMNDPGAAITGPITLAGNSQWMAGTILDNVTNMGTMVLSGSGAKLIGIGQNSTLNNAGTIVDNGTGDLVIGSGAGVTGILNNQVGAIVDLKGDGTIRRGGSGGSAAINNAGTFRKSAGVQTTIDNLLGGGLFFNNQGGTIDVRAGTLTVSAGGTCTGGIFIAATGAVLDLAGGGSTYVLTGNYTGSGAGTVQFSGGTLSGGVGGATFNFPRGLLQWNNFVTIVGEFANTGEINWRGGALNGIMTNAGTINLSGSGSKFIGISPNGTLNNAGTIIDNGTGDLVIGGGSGVTGTLNNQAGAVIDLKGDGNIRRGGSGGTAIFNNAGTFLKSFGTHTTLDNLNGGAFFFNNQGGIIDVEQGTLTLTYGTCTGGDFKVAAGAVLDLTGGWNVTYTGTYTGSGAGTVELHGGTLTTGPGGATFNFPTGLLHCKSVQVSGTITNAGAITCDSLLFTGTITNNGSITIADGGYAGIGNGANGTLDNAGTIVLAGTGELLLGAGAGVIGTLNNEAGGLVEFQGDGTVSRWGSGGLGVFDNSGLFRKSSGSNNSLVHLNTFSNTGTVEVTSGQVTFDQGVAQVSNNTLTGGSWSVLNGARLTLDAVINTNQGNISVSGPGSTFDGLGTGSLTNSGNLTIAAGSILQVSGNYTQSASGLLSVEVGGPSSTGQFGQLNASGTATLDGTLHVNLTGFGIHAGDRFPILNFADHRGNFGNITGLTSGRVRLFDTEVTPKTFFVDAATNTADLTVDSMIVPASGVAGQNLTIGYTVRNKENLATSVDS